LTKIRSSFKGGGAGESGAAGGGGPFSRPWKIPAAWTPAVVFALGVLLLLPSVWSVASVTGMDEYGLSFRTPMEMLQRGEWLTPWVNGEPRLQKPPLLYWAILLNYKLFGVHLVSARVWGVLSGAGLAACACLFSRRLFLKDGLLAGLLTLAAAGVAVEGRRAMLDLPSALFSTLAVLCFVKWAGGDASRLDHPRSEQAPLPAARGGGIGNSRADDYRMCLAGGAPQNRTGRGSLLLILLTAFLLSLSFLTKGPVGFVFFGAGVFAWLVVFRPWSFLAKNWRQLLAALALLAAVCLPWPLAMRFLWADRFSKVMAVELAARDFGRWIPGSPLSVWGGALGLVLPWTPLVLAAACAQSRWRACGRLRESRFLVVWFVLAAVPFFFMRSFERYMLGLVPAQIALGAEWLDGDPTRAKKILLRICVVLLALVSLAFCLFAWWFKLAVWEALAALVVTGLTVFLAFRPAHPHWVAFASALLFTVVLGGVYPRIGINSLPANLRVELAGRPVKMFNPPQPSMLSMLVGRSVQEFHPEEIRGAGAPAPAPEMVFVDNAHNKEFLALLEKNQLQAVEQGRFRTLYSRTAWLRFVRPDATTEDWKTALRDRSLEGLKYEFRYYLVSVPPP
jgi:4-amino-4-deoxy-L-arabinose transferase-like glycosyltransferase